MDTLSPAARDTLLALRDGPGNVHEVLERSGRSRSGTDKALRELAKQELITKVEGGDPADGAPARWQLSTTGHDTAEALNATGGEDDPAYASTEAPARLDTGDAADLVDSDTPTNGGPESEQDAATADLSPPTDPDGAAGEPAATGAATGGVPAAGTAPDDKADGASGQEEAEPAKLCRSCGAQMAKICPHCWQKTPGYCGTCRQQMPQGRRGEPGEPSILPSGLPRLRPGQLERLVLGVIKEHPLPDHIGIKGWTAQRVAIYLPGRSTGAIGNALTKLNKTGDLELIGENPMRFQTATTTGNDPQQEDTAEQGGS
jgi:hypothetical protein